MDSLLGAAGRGDIGGRFPNTDHRWAGADSRSLLREVMEDIQADRWRVCSADCTLLAEAPKISAYIPEMKGVIAPVLGIEGGACGIKATTCEKLGAIGRGEGIAAMAVVLLMRQM